MRKVMITGVSGAIGSSAAGIFHSSGWEVLGIDKYIPSHSYCENFIELDLSSAQDVMEKSEALKDKYIEGIDSIIFNAALQIPKKALDYTLNEWNETLMVNVTSIQLMLKCLLPVLKNSSLILISSVHAKATSAGLGGYAVSKGAMATLARVLSIELAEYGIRCNAILPGAIESTMLNASLKRSPHPEQARQQLLNSSSLKRIGEPEDIGNLALFLADNKLSSNITGQEIICDSGVLSRLPTE